MLDREEALDRYENNEYKQEILETEAAGEDPVSVYEQGEFYDLCQGPHVESTGEIGGFALLEISASYWRGDEENDTLTRVYGTAFPTESELDDYLERRQKAQERDHRKIGREMDLFSIDETTGPGLPLYEPNGKRILNELSDYAAGLNEAAGYDEVETPHVFRTELWKKSGHYENYVDDMFLLDVNDEEYGLKPMNCPGHATIFDQQSWSYRDPPVRYFEDGKVYRKEQRGELSGLSRTWAFTIDDGHLFVRPDQIEDEVQSIMDIIPRDALDVQPGLHRPAGDPSGEVRRQRRDLGEGGVAVGIGPSTPGRRLRRRGGRRGVLRPEDRLRVRGRARSQLGRPHRPAGLQHARAVRPELHR